MNILKWVLLYKIPNCVLKLFNQVILILVALSPQAATKLIDLFRKSMTVLNEFNINFGKNDEID